MHKLDDKCVGWLLCRILLYQADTNHSFESCVNHTQTTEEESCNNTHLMKIDRCMNKGCRAFKQGSERKTACHWNLQKQGGINPTFVQFIFLSSQLYSLDMKRFHSSFCVQVSQIREEQTFVHWEWSKTDLWSKPRPTMLKEIIAYFSINLQ